MQRIKFETIPWIQSVAGVRFKSVEQAGCRVRLVEFATEFSEAEWCHKAHIGYVLAGLLEIQLAETTETLSVGDALIIALGERHKARVIEGPVRLFLVEEEV